MSEITEAAERFKTRTAYVTSPIMQYGLPKQCYLDMLTLAKAAGELRTKLDSAEHVINEIYAELEKAEERSRKWYYERNLMAKLAKCQDSPQFYNPLEAMVARDLRDKILAAEPAWRAKQ